MHVVNGTANVDVTLDMKSAYLAIAIVICAVTSSGTSFGADPPPPPSSAIQAPAAAKAPASDDDKDLARNKVGRASLADYDAKLRATLKADPRVAPLSKELGEIAKIKDLAARKSKLEAIAPRILAVRNDAMKRAGIDAKELASKTDSLKKAQMQLSAPEPAPPPPPGSVISTATSSNFNGTFIGRADCPDKADRHDFDGANISVVGQSSVFDNDCWGIKAGKSATFQVPEGTKKITVTIRAKVNLDVTAISFGAFAEATGSIGIRIRATNGAPISNGAPYVDKALKSVHAINHAALPVPFDYGAFTDEIQDGDSGSTASVTFDARPGPTLEIGMWTKGWVDADLQGLAIMDNNITPRSIKVVFYR